MMSQTVTKAMRQLKPPISLGKPENEEHLKYLWSDEVSRKDFDYPEVSGGTSKYFGLILSCNCDCFL